MKTEPRPMLIPSRHRSPVARTTLIHSNTHTHKTCSNGTMMKRTPDLTAIFQVETWLASCPTEGRRYVTTLANLGKLFTPVCLEADRLHYPRESFRGGLWNHRRTFVCLSVTTITKQNVDGSGRNFLGRFLGGKASLSSLALTLQSLAGCGFYCPKTP